jgi:hypothetical protein
MSISLSTFFWLSGIYVYLKYSMNLSPHYNWIFLILIIILMYFINMSILQTKCNSSNSTVFSATLFPWVFIFGTMMYVLTYYHEWKRPFSNTFGYLVAKLFNGNQHLKDILNQDAPLDKIYNDPSLLINQFTTLNFQTKLQEYNIKSTPDKIATFYNTIKIKEHVAEWIWYILTANMVITTSYTMIMNSTCTKSVDDYVTSHSVAMASSNTPAPEPTTYNITE